MNSKLLLALFINLTLSRSINLNRRHGNEDHSMSIMPFNEDINASENNNGSAADLREAKFSKVPIAQIQDNKISTYTNSNDIYDCKAGCSEGGNRLNNQQMQRSQQGQSNQQQNQQNNSQAQNNKQQNQNIQQTQRSQQNNSQTQSIQKTPHTDQYNANQMSNQPKPNPSYTSTKIPNFLPQEVPELIAKLPVVGNLLQSLNIDSLVNTIVN
ncbi:hypothetical protein K502DRAFT_348149 [Neoconidiobolus thromboides FSU 785]|nr:hypothetical protein K502DRAFT_348149 [Neoconidiobolus thromboides FSU 785]